MSIEQRAEQILETVDREGTALSLDAWIELLQTICSQCESRVRAAQEDQRRASATR